MSGNKTIYLILIVILGFVGYNLMTMHDVKTDISKFNQKIEKIQTDIDSISMVNKGIDTKIESINSEITLVDNHIDSLQNNINTIKKETNEKIDNVDTFSFDELTQFFAERYRTRINNGEEGFGGSDKSTNSQTDN